MNEEEEPTMVMVWEKTKGGWKAGIHNTITLVNCLRENLEKGGGGGEGKKGKIKGVGMLMGALESLKKVC